MKKAVEENQNLDFKERMRKVAITFLSHRQCSVQEAVYQLLPELWLRKTFPAVVPMTVFKKNNLDRYMDRPNQTFKRGKYIVLDSFCYAQFLAFYYLDKKDLQDE